MQEIIIDISQKKKKKHEKNMGKNRYKNMTKNLKKAKRIVPFLYSIKKSYHQFNRKNIEKIQRQIS